MAEYAGLTDQQLAAEREQLQGLVARYGERAQRELSLVAAEQQRRAQAARLAEQEAFDKERDSYAAWYRELPQRLETQVAGWQPPPHPRRAEAIAAELSPQIARHTWSPVNKPLVKTEGMWNRDQRAAELARLMQAERQRAERSGPVHLAAFDQALPLVPLVNTEVKDTWSPGLEPWGLVNKGLGLPGVLGSVVGGAGELAWGQLANAAGVPSKAYDDRGETLVRTLRAGDDLLGSIPTASYNMITGDGRVRPSYQQAYMDAVQGMESEPMYRLRPTPDYAPSSLSYDLSARAGDYTEDITRGLGWSPGTRAAANFGSALLAGTLTDPFMPYGGGARQFAKELGKDLAVGGGILGAAVGWHLMPPSQEEMERQAVEQHYEDMLTRLRPQNRIAR